MLVSFLLPTRNRKELCINSIRSIVENVQDKTCFEIIFAFDQDDHEADRNEIIQYLHSLEIEYQYILCQRQGYLRLHYYYNEMSKIARGEYTWVWNDDALMETKDWDVYVRHGCMIYPEAIWDFASSFPMLFPMIPKRYLDVMHHYSLHPHPDTWVSDVFRILDIIKLNKAIRIKHYAHDEPDKIDYTEKHNVVFSTTVFQRDDPVYHQVYWADARLLANQFFPEKQITQPDVGIYKRIGIIGMNSVSFPMGIAMAEKGHYVYGYDTNKGITIYTNPAQLIHMIDDVERETMNSLIEKTKIKFLDNYDTILAVSDILFVAIDQEDEFLQRINKIMEVSNQVKKQCILLVTHIPTKLSNIPVSPYVTLCYTPLFIRYGTVLKDFYNPEFILMGTDHETTKKEVSDFYKTICGSSIPIYVSSIETIEMLKVFYDTILTTKKTFISSLDALERI
jgi:hypothetical protein